eukprot:CAMPEP_0171264120 /NCGR_PEP_ID=MMETSP0790-20130122/57451_1 /TAXON_ID=2925 /ORGANISM="Alexandrium catenella, Strain OF101" /LENGTH=600 /DNA_ID=CAMNT_0011732759 /DNA_START=23 /DNA_END=1825 /DNA_ORIENTATION=+
MAELPSKVDGALRSLQTAAKAWREMPNAERAAVARACRAQLATMDMDWVAEDLRCIGIDPSKRDANNSIGFDPFLFVSTTAERLDSVAKALEGSLTIPAADRQLPSDGPSVYKMGPINPQGAPGCDVELWAAPAGSEAAGEALASGSAALGASIVLGAGNQNFLTTVDVIERAFVHKECVLLKHHPIRPFMAGAFAHLFEPLARCGAYTQFLDADLAGAHTAFITHPAVSHVHMTGSGATHDRIVAALKAAGRNDVGFTSELGCVSPWIICPGKRRDGVWEEEELLHHAKMLTEAFKSSCSMNCLSPKVLVLPSEAAWPQRARFLELLKSSLATRPQPPPYYPGAHARFSAFEKEYPDAEKVQAPPVQAAGESMTTAVYPGQDLTPLPSLLVDVGTLGSPSCRPYALTNEAFAPVLAVVTVEPAVGEDYPMAAAKAVNEHLFGTLSCTLVHPDERDEAVDAVIRELNYGCVALNMWAALGYSNSLNVWGGAPGSYSRERPQSGLDFVGNLAGVPNVRKGVVVSAFVNKGIVHDKAIPLVVLDSLLVLASGKRFVFPRILGILVSRGFGMIPRRFPSSAGAEDAGTGSRARQCLGGARAGE